LYTHALTLVGNDPAKVSREVDHQSATERLASQAGPCPAGMNGQVVLSRVTNDRDHITHRPRPHNSQGPQLVNAGIGGVQLRENIVAANVASHESAQVFFNSLLVWIHFE
jgi:hypothetical protein